MSYPLVYSPDLGSRLRAASVPVDRAIWLRAGSGDRELFSAFPGKTILLLNQSTNKDYESSALITFKWPDFWLALRNLVQEICPSSPVEHASLEGGLMGFLGYEQAPGEQSQPFPIAYMGLYPSIVRIDHSRKTAELVHLPGQGALDEGWSRLLESAKYVTKSSKTYKPFTLLHPFSPRTSLERYRQDFDRIQRYLQQGDCYQVNYAQAFRAECTGDSASAMDILLKGNNAAHAAWLSLPEGDIFSLSPELFLRVDNGQITSKPIKGTAPRLDNAEADARSRQKLAASEKNQAENLMIVDLLRHDIGRHAETGSVHVDKLFEIESLPNVHHLVSTVSAQLRNDASVIDLIQDAFPGGSITGAPKKRAMEIIAELEPTPRSIYCGSIGYISSERDAYFNIAIRTLLRTGNELYAWAGGGIVADSECGSEYRECFYKIGALMGALEKADKQ